MAKKKNNFNWFTIIAIAIIILAAFYMTNRTSKTTTNTNSTNVQTITTSNQIPQDVLSKLVAPDESQATEKNAYQTLNNNEPYFTKDELMKKSFEEYSTLDSLGRVGVANAIIGTDLMPTEKREEIAQVRPSGWQSNKTAHVYDRCHLIAFQLAGENANEKNLATGTRFMNLNMIPFENQVADYVKKTKNHVRYRVTPVFKGNDLVVQGVIMEAMSVEDNGKGVKYNVFLPNFQKGVTIDYKTGKYTLK